MKCRGWRTLRVLAVASLLFLSGITTRSASLHYQPAAAVNPLKGLFSEHGRKIDQSLEYVELPLSDVMVNSNHFDWSKLRGRLSSIAAKGRHAVVRFYIDWPERKSGLPQFLSESQEAASTITNRSSWRFGARLPNYNSPILRHALTNFVYHFGHEVDGRPELGFVEAGLLGAWGEWLYLPNTMEAQDLKKALADAYEQAFTKTRVLLREPQKETLSRNFGYHDDLFGHKRGGFQSKIAAIGFNPTEVWSRVPIGGRIDPGIEACFVQPIDPCPRPINEYLDIIRQEHLTFLRFRRSSYDISGEGFETTRALSSALGYELFAAETSVNFSAAGISLSVSFTNSGAAPFYYRWPFEIAVAEGNEVVERWQPNWDIRKIVPGRGAITFQSTHTLSKRPKKPVLLLRVPNSLPLGQPIHFANKEQNTHLAGWVTLWRADVAE